MPCWEIRTVTVALDAADRTALVNGLKAAGFTVQAAQADGSIQAHKSGVGWVDIAGGYVTVREGNQAAIAEVKQAYAREVVRTQLRSRGFTDIRQDARGRLTASRRG